MKHTPQSLERRKVRTVIDWSSCGQTLIGFLSSRFPYRNETAWRQVISDGEITINGRNVPSETCLAMHDIVEYMPKELPEPPANMDYSIIFEDEHLLVINKPGNLCVHPAGPFFKHTLWHMLCSKYGDIHFVNRLDRETSGLMIAAKDKETASKFAKRDLIRDKIYTVMVHGKFAHPVHANGFIGKDLNSSIRKKRHFNLSEPDVPSENAETLLEPIAFTEKFSLIRAALFTGRMHQIRATLCSMGYPVAGDKLYGLDETMYLRQKTDSLSDEDKNKLMFPHQALHSRHLSFIHPFTGELMEFEAKLSFFPDRQIAVTGAEGFIGSFFVSELEKRRIPFIKIERSAFDDEKKLESLLAGVEKVFHFAGLSRHEDGDFLYRTNMELSRKLAAALREKNTILYLASSPHVLDHDLPYHRSKRDSMKLFSDSGVRASALLLPNTFGPGSKPFYNSVVSTFACMAAQKRIPERIDDVALKLVPVRNLCTMIADAMQLPFSTEVGFEHQTELPLPELWERLNRKNPEDDLDLLLFEARDHFLTF